MGNVRAGLKLAAFTLWCMLAVPLQMIVLAFDNGKQSYVIPYLWQRGVCRIFGLKVRVKGTPNTAGQTLFVSNHLSYLDIPVIGSILKASFIAKAEVRDWPVFGFLSKLQQTAFISRARSNAAREKHVLANMLAGKKSLIFFPEGTSSDGTSVLAFKSSLFGVALDDREDTSLTIQALTITLLTANKQRADSQEIRDLYAWHGDMTMPPHLWAFAKSRGAELLIRFHPPRQAKDFKDRKELANICRSDVVQGLQPLADAA